MRQGQQNRRGRGRGGSNSSNNPNNSSNGNRKPQNPLSRTYESSGPDVKIRGTAAQIAEKYMALSRDASASSDTVMAENYLQHAEHYIRIIMAAQAANAQQAAAQNGADTSQQGHGHGMNGAQRPHREANRNLRDQPQPHITSHPGVEPQPVIAEAEKPEAAPQQVEKAEAPMEQPAVEANTVADEQKTADSGDQDQPRRRRRRYPSTNGNGSRASANGSDDGATERTGQAVIAEASSPGEATTA